MTLTVLACWCLVGAIFLGEVQGESCMPKFKNAASADTYMKKCQTQVGITDAAQLMPDALEKSGYEDKCYYKCALTEMKLMLPDGKFDMAKCEEDFKANSPADKYDALIAIVKSCNEAATKNPLSKDPCKFAAIIKSCYLKQEKSVC